jgi:hypothetical protein
MRLYELYDIPRSKMPQVDADDLEDEYELVDGKVKLSRLQTSQEDRVEGKVDDIKKKIQAGDHPDPIIIDKTFHIVDGHHRYEAYKDLGYEMIPAIMADATVHDIAKDFAHTRDDTPVSESYK